MTAPRATPTATPPTPTAPRGVGMVVPIVDYEPAPVGAAACKPPSPAALHRSTPRPLRRAPCYTPAEPEVPRAAAVFADAALRRALEVADRRRPAATLKPMLVPALIDAVLANTAVPSTEGAAVLRRLRMRTAATTDGEASAVEVFGTFSRGRRIHAVAGRIEVVDARWQVVALQLG